jgi:S-DNA-T family DNA segregation ATPase FtsK/SpoIIIE
MGTVTAPRGGRGEARQPRRQARKAKAANSAADSGTDLATDPATGYVPGIAPTRPQPQLRSLPQDQKRNRPPVLRPPAVRQQSAREPAPQMPGGKIDLQSPPEVPEQQGDALSQALTFLPMGAMAIGMIGVVAGGHTSPIMYISSGAMGIGMVGMMVGQLVRGKSDRKLKLNGLRRDYLRYLSQARARVRRAADQQRAVMEHDAPAPDLLPGLVLAGEVWQRGPGSADFVNARFAVGTQALAIRLVPPETKPVEDLDALCVGALRTFIRTHASVPALPVSVRLSSVTRICPSGDREAARDMVRALLAQIAVAHSPADVTISVCASSDRIAEWEWLKWLPHNGHPTEADAAGPARLMMPGLDWLAGVLGSDLRDRPRFGSGAALPHPFHIVVADGVPVEGEVVGVAGVVIIDMSGDIGQLAGQADHADPSVLRLRVTRDQVYRLADDRQTPVGVPDALSRAEAEALARLMAPIRPASLDAPSEDALAADVSLATLLGVPDPAALDIPSLWRQRAQRYLLRVPIGTDADGAPVELDIKESAQGGMGPHGLLVGATGSGKSELLRTLVLGLAMTHDPAALNFVLVDFKGGATFLGLENLPHVSAVITNLEDELPLVDRMRDALHGEVVRRQEVFRAAGNYASLRDYTRARSEGADIPPMSTLFVVLDEFSELLAAKPEFIDLFVMIGRVGRSLGVHLLLASQRLEEGRLKGLETQLSYRVGLRTFSAQESRTVLGVPDAYSLPSQPGNGYLKFDTTDMTRFKAAYVSGPVSTKTDHPERAVASALRPAIAPFGPAFIPPTLEEVPGQDEAADSGVPDVSDTPETLLDIVVSQLAGRGPAAHAIWLPPLDEPSSLDALLPPLTVTPRGLTTAQGEDQASLHAVLGIVDKPFEQRRDPLWVDLSGGAGHAAVVGAPRSGKSTTLRTLLSSLSLLHTPAEVQFYILDFGGGMLAAMDGLPHVGGVATRLQADRVRRTVAEVRALLGERERSFTDQGIDSIGTYRRLVTAGEISGDGFGDVFLVIDGWLTLRQDFEELEPVVTSLAARGLGYGIHVVAATNKWSEFRPAVRDLYGTRLELRLGDPYESEVGRAAAANVPEAAPGRGLTRDGLHFLTAVPRIDGQQTGTGLPEAARAMAVAIRDAWQGPAAPPVRMLPAVLPVTSLPAGTGHAVPFGIDENALAPVSADFSVDPHFLIIGDTECGKSNLLRVLCAGITSEFAPEQARLIFVDYRRSLLDSAEVPHKIGYATSSASAGPLLNDVREALVGRLPPPDLTAEQLRARSWWSGAELYIVVDDYDLVSGASGSPLGVLSDLLPQARDIGLHLILARSAGGAGRAMFEPVIQRLREMGTPGVIMSGSRDEGQLFGGVRPSPLPQGRGYFVERRAGSRLIQVALQDA